MEIIVEKQELNTRRKEIEEAIKRLDRPRVLVVGDLAIDEMVYGNSQRISREAPVLILEHYKTNIILGGGSNAAHNIAAINGGKAGVIGVCGTDYYAPILKEAFSKAKIDTRYVVEDESRATTVKTRISGSCAQSVTQQIVRIDRQTVIPLSAATEAKVIANLEKAIPEYDAVILSDYHLGFLTDKVVEAAIRTAKRHGKVVTVDAQKDLDKYKGVSAMTPNQPDTEKFVGYYLKDDELLQKAGRELLSKTDAENIVITRGGDGMIVFEKGGKVSKIPAFNKTDVFDVTGAGDTVIAVFTLALAAGAAPEVAAMVGNIAASIVIRHFGCATTTVPDMLEYLDRVLLK